MCCDSKRVNVTSKEMGEEVRSDQHENHDPLSQVRSTTMTKRKDQDEYHEVKDCDGEFAESKDTTQTVACYNKRPHPENSNNNNERNVIRRTDGLLGEEDSCAGGCTVSTGDVNVDGIPSGSAKRETPEVSMRASALPTVSPPPPERLTTLPSANPQRKQEAPATPQGHQTDGIRCNTDSMLTGSAAGQIPSVDTAQFSGDIQPTTQRLILELLKVSRNATEPRSLELAAFDLLCRAAVLTTEEQNPVAQPSPLQATKKLTPVVDAQQQQQRIECIDDLVANNVQSRQMLPLLLLQMLYRSKSSPSSLLPLGHGGQASTLPGVVQTERQHALCSHPTLSPCDLFLAHATNMLNSSEAKAATSTSSCAAQGSVNTSKSTQQQMLPQMAQFHLNSAVSTSQATEMSRAVLPHAYQNSAAALTITRNVNNGNPTPSPSKELRDVANHLHFFGNTPDLNVQAGGGKGPPKTPVVPSHVLHQLTTPRTTTQSGVDQLSDLQQLFHGNILQVLSRMQQQPPASEAAQPTANPNKAHPKSINDYQPPAGHHGLPTAACAPAQQEQLLLQQMIHSTLRVQQQTVMQPNSQIIARARSSPLPLSLPLPALLSLLAPVSLAPLAAESQGTNYNGAANASRESYKTTRTIKIAAAAQAPNTNLDMGSQGGHQNQRMSSPPAPPRAVRLGLQTDRQYLSEYQTSIRDHFEFFESTNDDILSTARGRRKKLILGQVGLRCRHCAAIQPLRCRGAGAVYYPSRIDGVYQAAQNMADCHLSKSCPVLSEETKEMIRGQRGKVYTGSGGKKYWVDACRQVGVYEMEDGLALEPCHSFNQSK